MSQANLASLFESPLVETSFKPKISDAYTEELIIGFCGPVGSPISLTTDQFRQSLEDSFGYTCIDIKLSNLIRDEYPDERIPDDEFGRIKRLIELGDELRVKNGPEYLAMLAIKFIHEYRLANSTNVQRTDGAVTSASFESKRVCFLIISIKNESEFEILRNVYRDLFHFVGVFSSLEDRKSYLTIEKRMAETNVIQIIDYDSGKEQLHSAARFSQTVSDTFSKCDVYFRCDQQSNSSLRDKVERYLNLIFNTGISTPTIEETSMYMAASAAANSACLSRQVGACLTDSTGNILGVGWNDVPKYGGNLYSIDKADLTGVKDKRCYKTGKCYNLDEKKKISDEIATVLLDAGLVPKTKEEKLKDTLMSSRLKGLIEFSRAVHAEMHAIINAGAINGTKISGGTLYCTTYPCHACARHIVAAGITKVYFIEPYPKSLAKKLHNDAISEEDAPEKVVILAFDGISPNRYSRLFREKAEKRKDDLGNTSRRKSIKPKFDVSLVAIPALEAAIVKGLTDDKTK